MQQRDRSVDEYAVEFLRLRRFAPYMISNEEKQAERFQQKLRMDIQMLLIPQQLKTYTQVLTIVQEIERGLIRKEKSQVRKDMMKKSFLRDIIRKTVEPPTSPPPTKQINQSP